MTKQEIINELKSKQLPVIIQGAGVVGEVVLDFCNKQGIPIECFSDYSKKASKSQFCDLEVIYTPELRKNYEDANIIITSATIKDSVDLLNDLGFENWYSSGTLLKDVDISQSQVDVELNYKKFAVENCILCHDGYANSDELFVRSIDLIITERCSLKCVDCSNLMQYYQAPQNCDKDMLLRSIDAFCATIDKVMDFRVIGGDVFMNKEWPIIVERLVDEPKAKRVVLYTNGTIVPREKDLPSLKHHKVLIIITNYDELSRNLTQLVDVCKREKIAYRVLNVDEWLDCAEITPHNRTDEENTQIYKDCCAKNMVTLSDGKLFRCPYAANANRLSAIPDYETDYVDLFQEPLDGRSISETKAKVRDYIWHKDFLKACDFCSGRPLSGNEVKPGVQVDKPLPYRKYETSP